MRLFTPIFCFIIITYLFGSILNKIDTIEQLEQHLEQKQFQVDSLIHEIYTLRW